MNDWQAFGNCAGTTSRLFFPDSFSISENRRIEAEAKAVCATCVVRQDCYESALTSNNGRREITGIWGGVNFEQWRKDHRTAIEQASKKRRRIHVA